MCDNVIFTVPSASSPGAIMCRSSTGRMCIQRCDECDRWHDGLLSGCQHCGSADFNWIELSGRATLSSWMAKQDFACPSDPSSQFFDVVVELEEGPRLSGKLHQAAIDELHVGLQLCALIDAVRGNVDLAVFRPR